MKVNIELQTICTDNLRGIPYYTINLVKSLISRNINEYSGTFFDYKKERNNREYVHKYICESFISKIKLYECNDLSFQVISRGCEMNDPSEYNKIAYNEYFKMASDIYHFPNLQNLPMNTQTEKTVVTVHDIMPLLPNLTCAWSKKSYLEFKNAMNYIKEKKDISIITDSLSSKNDMINLLSFCPDRIDVIPLAYDSKIHFHEKNDALLKCMKIEGPYLLYLAAIDIRKGILDILDAFEQIKEIYSDLKLVFAGKPDPNASDFYDKLEHYKYKSDVILTGFVTDEQKRVLMSSAEVFLFPSEYEGFGLPVLEAMACGSPVVTTNVSSLSEAGGNAAIYISPNSPEEMADATMKILNSENYRNEIIRTGYEHIKKFSWNKTAELTEKVYKKIFSRNR